MKVLQVIESAYRCTIEEQDDPAVWITHAMKGAGGEFGVLLRGNAVNYAVRGQDASGLKFGDCAQTQPPQIDSEVGKLMEKGIAVFVVEEDCAERGISEADCIDGIKTASRSDIPTLFDQYDQIWHW